MTRCNGNVPIQSIVVLQNICSQNILIMLHNLFSLVVVLASITLATQELVHAHRNQRWVHEP